MSLSTPPQGTHFSDGVRVGPILGSTFVGGQNVFAPSTVVPSPVDQLPPGIFTTPTSFLDITPFAVSPDALMDPFVVPAAGYLPLKTATGNLIKVVTYQAVQNVIQLDCPRNLSFTGVGTTIETNLFIYGWDQYGMPMVEQLNGPTGATTAVGKKAFLYIRAIYADSGTTGTISVGIGNVFGLPFLVAYPNYTFVNFWDNDPSAGVIAGDQRLPSDSTGDVRGTMTPITPADGVRRLTINFYNASGDARNYNAENTGIRLLGVDPLTTNNGSSTIRVHAPNHQFIQNEKVTISGAISFNGITSSQSNITASVNVIDADTFTYQSNGAANFSDSGGGGLVSMNPGTGNLYRTSIGRFGVPQYNIPLI